MSEASKQLPLLPKGNQIFGVWVPNGDGDVHAYVQSQWVVIGQNKSFKDNIEFSDMALAFCPDGCYRFQYADNKGESVTVDLPKDVVVNSLIGFLRHLKSEAILAGAANGTCEKLTAAS